MQDGYHVSRLGILTARHSGGRAVKMLALAARLQRRDHYRSVLLSDWSASSWRKQHEFSDGPCGEDVGDGGALSQFNKHI